MTMLISATIVAQNNPLAKKPVVFPISSIAFITNHDDQLLAQAEVHLLTGAIYLTKEPLHKMLAEMMSGGANNQTPEDGLRVAPPDETGDESENN